MRTIISVILVALTSFTLSIFGECQPQKIAIIKADDIRGITSNWNRFFEQSQAKGVQVSAGVICETLEKEDSGYDEWLRKWSVSGGVEFWNHGWDHKRWQTEDGSKISEFGGTGYGHQKSHFDWSQQQMKRVFGYEPIAFGTPYNAVDTDTIQVMQESPNMRLFFCYGTKPRGDKILAAMVLRGEHDGTGKPNFAKFKAAYFEKPSTSFSAIQFHPNYFEDHHFEEYGKILDFLLKEGWIFLKPGDYVRLVSES